MFVRSPHLYSALRYFCLAAFARLGTVETAYSVESDNGFVQYRPLVASQVEREAASLAALEDTQIALGELTRERAAALYGHAPFETLLLPLVVSAAEHAGGFDWSDSAFDRAYGELEQALFGEDRLYVAVAPLQGLTVRTEIDLGRGVRIAPPAELVLEWTAGQGRTVPPDGPGELADAVTALRLATGAPVAAGPLVRERLAGRPLGARPILDVAAATPPGDSTRLDEFRGRLAHDLREQIGAADGDAELEEALDRWELSLFQDDHLGSEQLSEALAVLLGGPDGAFAAAARAAVLLGETPQERAELFARLRDEPPAAELVRRALVEVVMHGDRPRLLERLDQSLLGLRPRPPAYFAAAASDAAA